MTVIARLVPFVVVSSLLVAAPPLRAQDDARRLWDSEFLKKRAPAATKPRPRKETYRVATPPPTAATAGPAAAAAGPAAATSATASTAAAAPASVPAKEAGAGAGTAVSGELVGVTVWRLRPSRASDSGDARLLVQEADNQRVETVEWTPERVEVGTAFAAGDRLRLSIESPRAGFLYVIDRELYADGTTSDPYLIFPTRRMRDGDNAVRAGKVIELPDRSAFKLTPLRDDYRGERLTILVTSDPLPDVTIPADAERLDTALVSRWETQWAAAAERLELVGGAGQVSTGTERAAAAQGRLLTQDDALPQTLYRVLAAPGSPVLISVPLTIAK